MTVVLFKLQCFFFLSVFCPRTEESVSGPSPTALGNVRGECFLCYCLTVLLLSFDFLCFFGTICAVSPQLLRRNCYINRCNPQGAGQIGSTPSGWFTRKCSQGIQAQEHLAPGDPKKVRFGYSLLKKSQFQGTSGGETNGELFQRPTPEIQQTHIKDSL